MRKIRFDATKKEESVTNEKRNLRPCLLAFPNGKRPVGAHQMALSASPRPKSFWYHTLAGITKPLLSLFFTRSRINPTCRVFRSNDAARENVSLYLKIDIYAHPGADSRYSEDASRFEGHRTLVFFFLPCSFPVSLAGICRPAGTPRKLHGIRW